jgi:hypothetical protein
MYEAFDDFLLTDTWYTIHPLDIRRFYKALNTVVRQDEFNPDKMGQYMRRKLGISDEETGNITFYSAVDRYRANAWAVKDYLEAINF